MWCELYFCYYGIFLSLTLKSELAVLHKGSRVFKYMAPPAGKEETLHAPQNALPRAYFRLLYLHKHNPLIIRNGKFECLIFACLSKNIFYILYFRTKIVE